eukprot:SAG11_NODE_17835_length_507_cov_2.149510_1_plen_137_part_10
MPPCACPPDPGLTGSCEHPRSQGSCRNTYPALLAAQWQERGSDTATECRGAGEDERRCEVTNEVCHYEHSRMASTAKVTSQLSRARMQLSVIGGGWANDGGVGTYTTSYTSGTLGFAELGFRTYYQSCGELAFSLST